VGAGAKVLGPIVLGDDVKVGANAVVVRDAPSGVTLVGVPASVARSGSIEYQI
jgi:serine O-acetyltransferase